MILIILVTRPRVYSGGRTGNNTLSPPSSDGAAAAPLSDTFSRFFGCIIERLNAPPKLLINYTQNPEHTLAETLQLSSISQSRKAKTWVSVHTLFKSNDGLMKLPWPHRKIRLAAIAPYMYHICAGMLGCVSSFISATAHKYVG